MSCHDRGERSAGKVANTLTIALAGNPNSGKSALFNAFTGIRQKTGNWPGVTVDRKEGHFKYSETQVKVIDLPGIYSLDATSVDERVTRDYLLSREASLIVNVVDATNLERNLYLTVQMLEMGVPMVVALNMMDVAKRRGVSIDQDKLAEQLGCPVVPVVAVRGQGLDRLKSAIRKVAGEEIGGGYSLAHDEVVEQAALELAASVKEKKSAQSKRWLALKLLEGDRYATSQVAPEALGLVARWQESIRERAGEDVDIVIADTRYNHAHAVAANAVREQGRAGRTMTDHIDRLVLSRWFGIPVFMAVMYLMFMFAINIGGSLIDLFDGVAGAILVDGFGESLSAMGSPDWLTVLLANGVGGGLQVVATFIPVIAALYLFLSAVEDSGYMARAAFVMDRSMRAIGLPGKAFVPLIVGFGCNVPGIMATRTLESERERKLTILMNPFMSCGARLPVYALFAAAFFPTNGQNVVFGLYLVGILVAIGTGLAMRKTLLPGTSTGFMMELPPYHLPTLKGVLLRTWDRLKLFLKEAGQIIVIMVLIINTLNSLGTDGSFGNEDSKDSVLSAVSQTVTPAFAPMGIREENWPATVGIFSGVLAKEVVVGALDSLYTSIAEEGAKTHEEPFDFWAAIRAALATVPENFSAVAEGLLDPLGMSVGEVSSTDAAAAAQEVSSGTFGAMTERFDGRIGAFSYLLFILLYFPCVATIGAIVREAGARWALFVACWTTGVAYATATLFYQAATFSRHPTSSMAWILGFLLAAVVGLKVLRRLATEQKKEPDQPVLVEGA